MIWKSVLRSVAVTVAILAVAGWSYAAEHPEKKKGEHPKAHGAEHPEKQGAEHAGSGTKATLTKEALAEAVSAYVKKESRLKGGHFLVYDKKAGKPLVLSLKKVHKERLSAIGDGVYFACADFETPEGKVYDLDIFMKGHKRGHLKVTEISVHKEAGVERYSWFEQDGIWKKKHGEGSASKESSMGGSGTKGEHSSEEHPTEEHPAGKH
jgi:hypothetical protein